jgi:hypothetical protein
MSVLMMDHWCYFTREEIQRLGDAGCERLLVFDCWQLHEPELGKYCFDDLLEYARWVREAGMTLLIQTPLGTPAWSPAEWYLVNEVGQSSSFAHSARCREWYTRPREHNFACIPLRIYSYWNREAQEYLHNYVGKVGAALEPAGAICISSIGDAGEYLWPGVYWRPEVETQCCSWWCDSAAVADYDRFRAAHPDQGRTEWMLETLRRVVRDRLALYSEKWLQFVPYFAGFGNFGNDGVETVVAENRDSLHTILFTVFGNPGFEQKAAAQAGVCPTWAGAEGAANVITNSRKAQALGLAGVICGPLFYGFNCLEPWMYENIGEAIRFWESHRSQ